MKTTHQPIDPLPAAYRYWPDYAQCRYRERVAILRESNNLPDDQPMTWQMRQCAVQQAEAEIQGVRG